MNQGFLKAGHLPSLTAASFPFCLAFLAWAPSALALVGRAARGAAAVTAARI